MSLKQTILEYIKSEYPKVVHKGELLKMSVNYWHYETENAGRRCRELENEGKIVKIPHPKGEAQYQWAGGIPEATVRFLKDFPSVDKEKEKLKEKIGMLF